MEPGRRMLLNGLLASALRATVPGEAAAAGPSPASSRGPSAGEPFEARTRDGLTLAGMRHGDPSAPPILFVHGLGQSRLSWDRQLPLANRFHLVTYDLRGHGDSDKPRDPAAYGGNRLWGDDLAAVLAASGVRRPVVVAWSMGGVVLGQYLRQHGAGALAGVNLVDAVTAFDPAYRTGRSAEAGGRLASPDLATRSRAIAEFLSLTFATPPAPADLGWMLAVNGMVPRALQLGLGTLSTDGFDAAYAGVPRLLLTHGERDALVRVAMAARMPALNPAARVSLYPEAGHSPFWESPERFNAELAAFALAAQPGTPLETHP